MNRFKTLNNYFDSNDIHSCKSLQDIKLIRVMEKKAEDLASCFSFASYSERLVFIDAFCKGYIAAFCVSDEQEELEQSLTPLGKELK